MSAIETWFGEIEELVSEIGAESGFGIEGPAGESGSQMLASLGFPGVLPLWRGTYVIVGLVAMPGVAPQAWPAVIVNDGDALTLATDARTALSRFIMQRLLSRRVRSAELFAHQWSRNNSTAFALHEALGGSRGSLEAVAAAASDDKVRQSFVKREGEDASFQATHSALARQIDRSDAFQAYSNWFDASISGAATVPLVPEQFGAWRRQALFWAVRLVPPNPAHWISAQQALLDLVEGFAGIDAGVPVRATWAAEAGGASAAATYNSLMERLDRNAAHADPVTQGLVNALDTERMAYDGYAHAEAVVALDERGEPERAWGALHSAAWWTARKIGEAPLAMLDGARLLADRHGWDDIRWVVDRATGSGK